MGIENKSKKEEQFHKNHSEYKSTAVEMKDDINERKSELTGIHNRRQKRRTN